MKRRIIAAGLALLSAGAAGVGQVAPATQPTAEAKLIAELYGKRIAAARASAETADNVALAREMLVAAADSVNPVLLRCLLAMEAVKLAALAGSADAAELATEALGLADKLKPLEPVEKCRLKLEIARRRYAFARKSGAAAKESASLAADVVKTEITLARALMREGKVNEANALLAAARTKARAHNLSDRQAEAEAATKALNALRIHLARIRVLENRLRRAEADNDNEAAKAARKNLGLLYLLGDGDIVKAYSYLAGTGHPYESSLSVASAFLKDPGNIPSPAVCNKAVEGLASAAKSAGNKEARVRIATPAMNLCRALLAGKPAGLEAAKTRLLLARVERLAGDSPADRLIRSLKANYGGLAGKIEVLNTKKKLVRLSYDFATRKQLGDWQIEKGTWKVPGGKNALSATPQRHRWARLKSRLRFRADKPLLFAFRAKGRQSLAGTIILQRRQEDDARFPFHHWLRFEFGAHRNRDSVMFDRHRMVWSSRRVRITPNTSHRIEIAWDGNRSVTWTINGKVLCKRDIEYRKEDLPKTHLVVGLETYGPGARFDDVSIEGVIIEEASRPEQPKQPERPERPERPRPEPPRRRRRPPRTPPR